MMVKVYETYKTTKNNLETKSVVLKDLHMSIGLNNMISTQKHSKPILNMTQNIIFWVLIRHSSGCHGMVKLKNHPRIEKLPRSHKWQQ